MTTEEKIQEIMADIRKDYYTHEFPDDGLTLITRNRLRDALKEMSDFKDQEFKSLFNPVSDPKDIFENAPKYPPEEYDYTSYFAGYNQSNRDRKRKLGL